MKSCLNSNKFFARKFADPPCFDHIRFDPMQHRTASPSGPPRPIVPIELRSVSRSQSTDWSRPDSSCRTAPPTSPVQPDRIRYEITTHLKFIIWSMCTLEAGANGNWVLCLNSSGIKSDLMYYIIHLLGQMNTIVLVYEYYYDYYYTHLVEYMNIILILIFYINIHIKWVK